MKKKAVAVTLAAGLLAPLAVVPSVTGITGFDRYISISTAKAAEELPNETLQQRLQKLYAKLISNSDNLQLAKKLRDGMVHINSTASLRSANKDLVSDTWSRVNQKIVENNNKPVTERVSTTHLSQENLLRLIFAFAVTYDSNGSSLQDVITDPELRSIADELIKLGGVPGGLNDVTLQDVNLYINAVNADLKNKLKNLNINLPDIRQLGEDVKDEYTTLLDNPSLKFSKVMKGLGITADDLEKDAIRTLIRILFPPAPPVDTPPPPPPAPMPVSTDPGVSLKPEGKPVTTPGGGQTVEYTINPAQQSAILDLLKKPEQTEKAVILEAQTAGDSQRFVIPAPLWDQVQKSSPNVELTLDLPFDVNYALSFDTDTAASTVASLGAELKDVDYIFEIKKVSGQEGDAVKKAAKDSGLDLVGEIFEFSLKAVTKSGKSIDIEIFEGAYGVRTIPVNGTVDNNRTTGVVVGPDGQLQFVPTTFKTTNGKTYAVMKRGGNSVYTVVKTTDKTYTDIQGHWGQKDIELLATKLLVKGVTDKQFAPDAVIKRSEFAALLVRALGLVEENGDAKFPDVKPDYWGNGAIYAAVKAGLIEGFEDGSFRPEAQITREQMAVMVSRAMKVADVKPSADPSKLTKFNDKTSISGWAVSAVAESVGAGILEGGSNETLAPKANATRAEAVAVFKRLLQYVKFID